MNKLKISDKTIFTIYVVLLIFSVLGVITINPAFLAMTGWSVGSLIGIFYQKKYGYKTNKKILLPVISIFFLTVAISVVLNLTLKDNGLYPIIAFNIIMLIVAVLYIRKKVHFDIPKQY